jgi:putative transcriptional regulator
MQPFIYWFSVRWVATCLIHHAFTITVGVILVNDTVDYLTAPVKHVTFEMLYTVGDDVVATLDADVQPMIRWKLREVMARKKITNRALADATGMHEGSISRLKALDEMPRMDGKTLSKFCEELDCSLFELVEYVPDAEASKDK